MFGLRRVCPNIYLLTFDNSVELCAHFMRFQEMYESDSPRFKGKSFELIDYITWYASRNDEDEKFTYFDDWGGFNIPLHIITDWKPKAKEINNYDRFMIAIAEKIIKDSGGDEHAPYLVGCKTGNAQTMAHEVAHGLYYTDAEYMKEMDELTNALPKQMYLKCSNALIGMGYDSSVIDDEIQAYMATGSLGTFPKIRKEKRSPFENVFKKYVRKKKIKLK